MVSNETLNNEARERLLAIDRMKTGVLNLEDKEKEDAIVKSAIEWANNNPNGIGFLAKVALGLHESYWGLSSPNPYLLDALGRVGDASTIDMLEQELEKCREQFCLYTKDIFKALLAINGARAKKAINSLLFPFIFGRRSRKLHFPFIEVLAEEPNPNYLHTLVKIIKKKRITFKADRAIVKMAESDDVPFEQLLKSNSSEVRFVAINALRVLPKHYLTQSIVDTLSSIVKRNNEKVLNKSYAADILKSINIEVPDLFRDRPLINTSDDLSRFVKAVLPPVEMPDDWAEQEIVSLRYKKDIHRVILSSSLGMNARVRIWQGCFWDDFVMGFYFRKDFWPSSKIKVYGICRAMRFETPSVSREYLYGNLDRLLISQAYRIMRHEGSKYMKAVEKSNEMISRGHFPKFRFWEVDKKKIEKQGGCPPPNSYSA